MPERAVTAQVRRTEEHANPLLALRAATADAHRQLDDGLIVTDPDLTVDAYRQFLVGLYGIVAPLEDHIAVHAPLRDWDDRRRAWMLRLDLGPLADTAPLCPFTPRPADADEALGAAYVLEGSTLGGVHVAAAVRRSVGSGAPTRWFDSHGDQVSARWQAFRRELHRHVDTDGNLGAVIAGAVATFDAMSAWLLSESTS
jgi:heme oxygenase (biliverdin-IX-beta and delta-forming)